MAIALAPAYDALSSAWFQKGGTMFPLSAPTQAVFLISVIIAIFAWIASLASIPYIGDHPSFLLTIAFMILAAGCLLDRQPAGR